MIIKSSEIRSVLGGGGGGADQLRWILEVRMSLLGNFKKYTPSRIRSPLTGVGWGVVVITYDHLNISSLDLTQVLNATAQA